MQAVACSVLNDDEDGNCDGMLGRIKDQIMNREQELKGLKADKLAREELIDKIK